jgi:hypothetical protein
LKSLKGGICHVTPDVQLIQVHPPLHVSRTIIPVADDQTTSSTLEMYAVQSLQSNAGNKVQLKDQVEEAHLFITAPSQSAPVVPIHLITSFNKRALTPRGSLQPAPDLSTVNRIYLAPRLLGWPRSMLSKHSKQERRVHKPGM